MQWYGKAVSSMPELTSFLIDNIARTKQKYLAKQKNGGIHRVAVCGWDLSHNAAGRAYNLAKLYERFAEVHIIGNLYSNNGAALWEPIRHTSIPTHTIQVKNWGGFIDQAIELVTAHPYDYVHLSKPRAPNIIFGLLYKLIWGAKVIVDIDDEELAFVGACTPISISEYLNQYQRLPHVDNLADKDWTRIAVSMVNQFDGVTVSNPALHARYGGVIIRHARDEAHYQPSEERGRQSRIKYGVPTKKWVVLFFGTPRKHKGLLETAQAISRMGRNDVLFVIVGDFPNTNLKLQLQSICNVDYLFIGNQPFEAAPEVVALADVVILLQQAESPIAHYQLPAKMGDALAMGVLVLATPTPALADAFEAGALIPVTPDCLTETLEAVFNNPKDVWNTKKTARRYFQKFISFGHNVEVLEELMASTNNIQRSQMWNDLAVAIGAPSLLALTMLARTTILPPTKA